MKYYRSLCVSLITSLLSIQTNLISHCHSLKQDKESIPIQQESKQHQSKQRIEHKIEAKNATVIRRLRLVGDEDNFESIYPKSNRSLNLEVEWKNVVVIMLTHNNTNANALLQSQFDTWIQRVSGEGLDIWIIVDIDDTRTDLEIIPQSAPKVKPNVHVYRSNAPKERERARSKVIQAFTHVYKTYKGTKDKWFYLKIDPDSYIIADHLLNFLSNTHKATHPRPVDFGRPNCHCIDLCYSLGGLYGMNKKGLHLALHYIHKNPDIYNHTVNPKHDKSINAVIHEDFFTSYAFYKATGYPLIESSDISKPYRPSIFPLKKNVISIHNVKFSRDMDMYEEVYYGVDESTKPAYTTHVLSIRSAPEDLDALRKKAVKIHNIMVRLKLDEVYLFQEFINRIHDLTLPTVQLLSHRMRRTIEAYRSNLKNQV